MNIHDGFFLYHRSGAKITSNNTLLGMNNVNTESALTNVVVTMEEDPAPAYSTNADTIENKTVPPSDHFAEHTTSTSPIDQTTSHIIHIVHCKAGSSHGCAANGVWSGSQLHKVSDAITISQSITFDALSDILTQKVTDHFNLKADGKGMKGAITLTSGGRVVQFRDQSSFEAARKVFAMEERNGIEITLTFAVVPARRSCEVM